MPFSSLFTIIKHFWPSTWFSAVLKEAEQVPAVVAGIFFTGTSMLVISTLAVIQYTDDANANEARLTSLQLTIAKNTAELGCARQDRTITNLSRQLLRLEQLAASSEESDTDLVSDLKEAKRKLNNAQTKYERECL